MTRTDRVGARDPEQQPERRRPATRPAVLPAASWQSRLDEAALRHGVPGAQLGVLRLGADGAEERAELATGTLNLTLGERAPATPDALFQIGSITKVWTTTAAMRLIERGAFTLETPVLELLPELATGSESIFSGVTVRHLMTHTSGIDGDIFTDTGRGDDCVEEYVRLLGDAQRLFPVGASWAYCNSGFVILGRIIERVTGTGWDAAMRELLIEPLGLENTVTLPEEAILRAAAVGHEKFDGEMGRTLQWALPRSIGPAGNITTSVGELLGFAALHLRDGVAADGTRLISTEHASMMRQRQAEVPDTGPRTDSWGLGWVRYAWGDGLVGHTGATLGQYAYLVLDPANGVAVALLTNGGETGDLYDELIGAVLGELTGARLPAPLEPAPGDAERWLDAVAAHIGTYETAEARVEFFEGEHGLRLRHSDIGPLSEIEPDPIVERDALPAGPDRLLVRNEDGSWQLVSFSTLPTGERLAHYGIRALPLVEAVPQAR